MISQRRHWNGKGFRHNDICVSVAIQRLLAAIQQSGLHIFQSDSILNRILNNDGRHWTLSEYARQ